MNLITREIFGTRKNNQPNTFLGGVSATISTPALLAAKLENYPSGTAFSVSNISNFQIIGNDIQCHISADYQIASGGVFNNETNMTYCIGKKCKDIGYYAFRYKNYLTKLEFEDCLVIPTDAIYQNGLLKEFLFKNAITCKVNSLSPSANEIFYIPNIVNFGTTTGQDGVFYSVINWSGVKIYCHPSLATNNGGNPDGDIQYAISQGATVRYVTNFTAPNPVTTLAAGTVYNTAIQLNFTPPSSTNAIDYYECYVNGVFNKNITASGLYITGLTANTSYNITVVAVDIFYNKSTVSNTVTQSTANNSWDIATGLVSYYKLDETTGTVANDSYGTQHLTNTGITVNQTGKIGNSYLSTASNQNLYGTGITPITGNFTINCWLYRIASPDAGNDTIIEQGQYGAGFGLWINSSSQLGWFINGTYGNYTSLATLPLNAWAMATLVYNGSNVKIYLDGVLKQTTSFTTNPTSATIRRMFNRNSNSEAYRGRIDEASIHNIALTQTDIDLIYNAGNGITL